MSEKPTPKIDPRLTVLAGGLTVGLGVGFIFFFPYQIFGFIGSIFAGIGVGLFLAAYFPPRKRN